MACLEGEKYFLSKKNIAAHLRFAKPHLSKPQDFWNNGHQTKETKEEKTEFEVFVLKFQQWVNHKLLYIKTNILKHGLAQLK